MARQQPHRLAHAPAFPEQTSAYWFFNPSTSLRVVIVDGFSRFDCAGVLKVIFKPTINFALALKSASPEPLFSYDRGKVLRFFL
jgi:hypothetical protein